jgi:hypothetical protein
VERAVAGKSLAKPKPEPRPEPAPDRPNPFPAFPNVPELPAFPNAGGMPGGIDVQAFNKAMELRKKAMDLMMKNPRDPEARKLLQEANDAMLKAARGGLGGGVMPLFPDFGRAPDRGRLGIRLERVPAVAADQLGLEPNAGIVVTTVVPDSAAAKAGLKVHDIVVEFAGKPVQGDLDDFVRQVGAVKAGEKVNLVVLRKGKKVEVKGVELPEAAKAFPVPEAGLPNLRVNPRLERPNLPRNPALGRAGVPAGFGTVSYTSTNGSFKLKASKGEAKFTLTGSVDAGGKPTVTKATVEDGDKTHSAESVAKLPEAYRADAEALLKTIEPRR